MLGLLWLIPALPLAGFLLLALAGLVGAYHLGRRSRPEERGGGS